jgi:hypothetical protein
LKLADAITVLGFNKLKDNKLNGHKAKITIRVPAAPTGLLLILMFVSVIAGDN